MPLKEVTRHASYNAALADYEFLNDAIQGEGAIKAKQEVYLPKTNGMLRDETVGASGQLSFSNSQRESRYEAYLRRAEFPEKVGIACDTASGLITEKPATVEFPDAWKSVAELATLDGDTVADLHRIVADRTCSLGRCGIWADLTDGDSPYWTVYTSEQITDWAYARVDGRKALVYLQIETTGPYEGEEVQRIRQVRLEPSAGVFVQDYKKGKDDEEYIEIQTAQPLTSVSTFGTAQVKNGKSVSFRLPWIPFQFIGAEENKAKIGRAPFLPLARQCRKAYMISATYMESLTLGEPTFYVTGLTKEWIDEGYAPKTVGLGTIWTLPDGATAGVVEPKGPIVSEQRNALNEALARADELSLKPFEPQTRMVEAAEAKKERRKTQTSAIKIMAQNIGSGIQKIMRLSAEWLGIDPASVTFEPSYEFKEVIMDADEAVKIKSLEDGGALSKRTVHENLQRGGLTPNTFEEEQELIGKGE